MQEIIRQYGRMIIVLTGVVALLALLFTGLYQGGVYGELSRQLTKEEPEPAHRGRQAAEQVFGQESLKVRPRMNLVTGEKYRTNELVSPRRSNEPEPVGGKIIQVLQIYDVQKNSYGLVDVSDDTVINHGQKVMFSRRGLYKLLVSLRDQKHHAAMQYVFVSIEE